MLLFPSLRQRAMHEVPTDERLQMNSSGVERTAKQLNLVLP